TVIALTAGILIFSVGIIIGENLMDLASLGIAITIFFLLTVIAQHYHRIDIGANLLSFMITFILLPITFFSGGGINGGSPMWFIFCLLYVSMILTGGARRFFIVANVVTAGVCYYFAYKYPEAVSTHSPKAAYQDSFISLVLVGTLVSLMVAFQIRIYMEENKRAEKQRKEIEDLNAAQNRFFSSMSHEIRTPINTIIGLNEMILREDISEEVAEDAQNVSAAGKMLLSLINDILDMSKLESGQMELSPVTYDAAEMFSEVVSMLSIRAKEKNLAFTVDIDPSMPSKLYGDEVRIKQILINILTNAIKYTKEGSVTFAVQCEYDPDSKAKAHILYEISDTGIGIRKESMPYLFTAFRRADEQLNRNIEGTGLGLSIVKQLVDLMGGNVTVNSVYTRGTKFVIELPQEIIDERPIGILTFGKRHITNERANYRQSFEAPDAKILVVDDTATNLLVVKKLLRETLVSVDTAESGAEALEKTLGESYHLIFMDHMMPEMDGVECLHLLREQTGGFCRNAKVVALTANAGSEVQTFYEKEGFDGYLVKPVTGEALERETFRLLPKELVHATSSKEQIVQESELWMMDHIQRRSIAVTTESVADLPRALIDRYHISILPHKVVTKNGIFRDGIEIETLSLLRYMADRNHVVTTSPPSPEEYELFFADVLGGANNIIHLSLSEKIQNSGYPLAIEAAGAFDNVTVIDTGHVSSGQGLFVIEACRMAAEGHTPAEIIAQMAEMKTKVHTSFIVDSLDQLARAKQVDGWIAGISKAFPLHPILIMKNGKMTLGNIYLGAREETWKKYIYDEFHGDIARIDRRLLFITYVGLSQAELAWIQTTVLAIITFDEIICQPASPAIAVNCGAGTFGLLYKEL
ncbi:MAG: DegV family EDD domain-containing protein, partial [Lachnospiraceae bacterium]|nr:DegV family EDD domain-containing protein [Lachnospiraceae bacterium]